MGRSRGGLTTKIHALVDANGLPVALKLTEGQAHDGRSAEGMLDGRLRRLTESFRALFCRATFRSTSKICFFGSLGCQLLFSFFEVSV